MFFASRQKTHDVTHVVGTMTDQSDPSADDDGRHSKPKQALSGNVKDNPIGGSNTSIANGPDTVGVGSVMEPIDETPRVTQNVEDGEDEDEEEEEEEEEEDDEEEEEDDDEDEDEEPRLKYARLTQNMSGLYRNGDATSTFVVGGNKMVRNASSFCSIAWSSCANS